MMIFKYLIICIPPTHLAYSDTGLLDDLSLKSVSSSRSALLYWLQLTLITLGRWIVLIKLLQITLLEILIMLLQSLITLSDILITLLAEVIYFLGIWTNECGVGGLITLLEI